MSCRAGGACLEAGAWACCPGTLWDQPRALRLPQIKLCIGVLAGFKRTWQRSKCLIVCCLAEPSQSNHLYSFESLLTKMELWERRACAQLQWAESFILIQITESTGPNKQVVNMLSGTSETYRALITDTDWADSVPSSGQAFLKQSSNKYSHETTTEICVMGEEVDTSS